ncbi:MAG: winged helix-turn-helix domain-containing protein [Candidatus Hodarchaeota archaeon]
MQTDENLTETFKALSHPLRQDIILILAERQSGTIGFTALQKELNYKRNKAVQVGTIYHHVKLLGDIIHQDESSKSWILSEKGWFAYNLLTSSQDRNQFIKQGDLEQRNLISLIWRILAPPELFFLAKKSFLLFLGWELIFFLIFALITAQANLVLFFVFFISDFNTNRNIFLSLGSILLSWILFTVITLILSKQLLGKKTFTFEDVWALMIFLGISLLPLSLFPLLVLSSIFDMSQQIVPLGIAVVLQFWVILLTARSISVQFFVRGERAVIVSLISIYLMVIMGLILGF